MRKRDPELAARAVAVLRRLNGLANGTIRNYEGGARGKAASTPPPFAESPFHRYLDWFLDARSDETLAARIQEAEDECDAAQGKARNEAEISSSFRAAAEWDVDGARAEEQQARFVVEMYRGKSPLKAAILEGDRKLEPWIRKVRRRHRVDEETGEQITNWDRWSELERRSQVRELRRRNPAISVRAVAEHLQAPKSTIQRRYWGDVTNPNKEAA